MRNQGSESLRTRKICLFLLLLHLHPLSLSHPGGALPALLFSVSGFGGHRDEIRVIPNLSFCSHTWYPILATLCSKMVHHRQASTLESFAWSLTLLSGVELETQHFKSSNVFHLPYLSSQESSSKQRALP